MDIYVYTFILLVPVIGLLCYKSYFSKFSQWINSKYQNTKLILSLIDRLNIENKPQTSFVINDTDMSANIVYERLANKYILFVPFNRKYIASMTQFKAELLRKNDTPIDITQQPGIPYMVSAKLLGGDSIRITNQETGNYHDYDNIPGYAEEIMDFE
jgi:hypothetical protein